MHTASNERHSGEQLEEEGAFQLPNMKASGKSFESSLSKEAKGEARSQLFCYSKLKASSRQREIKENLHQDLLYGISSPISPTQRNSPQRARLLCWPQDQPKPTGRKWCNTGSVGARKCWVSLLCQEATRVAASYFFKVFPNACVLLLPIQFLGELFFFKPVYRVGCKSHQLHLLAAPKDKHEHSSPV